MLIHDGQKVPTDFRNNNKIITDSRPRHREDVGLSKEIKVLDPSKRQRLRRRKYIYVHTRLPKTQFINNYTKFRLFLIVSWGGRIGERPRPGETRARHRPRLKNKKKEKKKLNKFAFLIRLLICIVVRNRKYNTLSTICDNFIKIRKTARAGSFAGKKAARR